MNPISCGARPLAFLLACLIGGALWAQNQKSTGGQAGQPPLSRAAEVDGPGSGEPPSFGPGGFGNGGPGRGGPPGMMHQKTRLVTKFDKDGDGRLNAAER